MYGRNLDANSKAVHVDCVDNKFPGGVCFCKIQELVATDYFFYLGSETHQDSPSGRRYYERSATFFLHRDGSSYGR